MRAEGREVKREDARFLRSLPFASTSLPSAPACFVVKRNVCSWALMVMG